MAMHTITAMFQTRSEAERALDTLRTDTSLAVTNAKVLPENDTNGGTAAGQPHETGGFMESLRNFFMPEEDRYGYAEGMRRGSYMVAADVDEAHSSRVMDILERAGAVDLDAEEQRWRSEGWRGYEPSSSATPGSTTSPGAGLMTGSHVPGSSALGQSTATGTALGSGAAASASGTSSVTGTPGATLGTAGTSVAGTEERIPLAEEQLRVGKRVAQQGRVRIRSYVVETPVTETVHLRDERVEVERRPVDRPLSASEADPFREREIEATETREEAVVAKDVRIREELVLHKSVEEHEETIKDTVRRTEVKEERGEDFTKPSKAGTNPTTKPRGL
jgi:uncharacterized protein (TIGR02271 family)